jgi:hypothetical protein
MSAPRLRGIEVSNRTAVFYSPEDLSVGLVGQSVDGIYGYDTDYATDLMENITLLALGGPVPPKVAPPKPVEPAAKTAPKPEDKKMDGGEKKPEKKPGETGEKKPADKKPKA